MGAFAASHSAPMAGAPPHTPTSMYLLQLSLTHQPGRQELQPNWQTQNGFPERKGLPGSSLPQSCYLQQAGKRQKTRQMISAGDCCSSTTFSSKNKWGKKNNKMKGQLCWPGAEGDICPHPSAIGPTPQSLFLVGSVFDHYSSLNCLTRTPVPVQGKRWEHGEREQVTTSSA